MNSDTIKDLASLKDYLLNFAQQRDWQKFHAPKNLSMALAVEVAELMEHFQWLNEEESWSLPDEKQARVTEELADIQMYLVLLAARLNVDLMAATKDKAKKNEAKYPVSLVYGSARKYTDY
jgi:dCTP diphosphatase